MLTLTLCRTADADSNRCKLGTTGVAIALLMRIKEIYGSVEEVEVLRRAQ